MLALYRDACVALLAVEADDRIAVGAVIAAVCLIDEDESSDAIVAEVAVVGVNVVDVVAVITFDAFVAAFVGAAAAEDLVRHSEILGRYCYHCCCGIQGS